ncbi:MAG: hypothetical protein ABI867_42550 [Kofleriaceae bacterium]
MPSDDSLSVGEALEQYFRDNGLSADTYTDRWVHLKMGPIPFAFPNTKGRIAAVKLHDLHHVATGYATSWVGEAEIGAWEVGAGCGRYYAAWVLNLSVMGLGMWISPRRVVRAFLRGRRSKTLYDRAFGDDLLALRVGELKAKLGLASVVHDRARSV